jgi:AMMECR1 domain-containing protein
MTYSYEQLEDEIHKACMAISEASAKGPFVGIRPEELAELRAKAETLDQMEALVREHDGRDLRVRHWATGDYWMITAGVGPERQYGYCDKRGNSIADAVDEFYDFEAKLEEDE